MFIGNSNCLKTLYTICSVTSFWMLVLTSPSVSHRLSLVLQAFGKVCFRSKCHVAGITLLVIGMKNFLTSSVKVKHWQCVNDEVSWKMGLYSLQCLQCAASVVVLGSVWMRSRGYLGACRRWGMLTKLIYKTNFT